MTKKAMVLAVVAALAYCAPASANVLSAKTAKSLAKRLATKQVRTRQIVSVHVSHARRVNAREIKFAYDDRSAQNVFCTSVIIVKLRTPTSTVARASFDSRANVCRPIPADALAFETATGEAIRAVGAQSTAVQQSLTAFEDSQRQCRRLAVPKNRRTQVAVFETAADGRAIFGPIDAPLQAFVNALTATPSSDGVLVAAAAGWTDALALLRSLPDFQPSFCAALKRWAAAGWALSAAPADYNSVKALLARAVRDQRAMARGARHLASLGVLPRTASAFTPDGLTALALE